MLRGTKQRKEVAMDTIIDLGSEWLVDRSRLATPQLRFLLTAIGQRLAQGSPWVAVNKKVAELYELTRLLPEPRRPLPAVA
jgi:hypothetical protein